MKFKLKSDKNKEIFYRILALGTITILAFLFSLQCSSHIWKTSTSSTDSSVFTYVARVILNGGMPYRDVFDHKGPLIYLFDALGLLISEHFGIWLIELITILTGFMIMYKTARLKCSRLISLGILLLSCSVLFKYFQWGNLTEEFAIPFISAGIYIFTDYFLNGHITKLRLIVCGFSFAAVCLLRVNMIPVWIVMCIGVLVHSIWKHQAKDLIFFLAFFLLGFVILTLPIIVWLAVNNSFEMFIDNYIVFNQQYSSFDTAVAALAARGSVFMAFFNETVVLLAFALQVYQTVKSKNFFDILYVAYFLTNMIFLSLSGHLFWHYGMIIVPSLIYPFANFYSAYHNWKKSSSKVLSLIFLYVVVTLAMPSWLSGADSAFQDLAVKDTDQTDADALAIAELVLQNSSPDDQILVCGNWNIIYNICDRFACTKYAYQSPPITIDQNIAEDYYREISENLPKVIVYINDMPGNEEVMKLIKTNRYKKAGKNAAGNITVYVR